MKKLIVLSMFFFLLIGCEKEEISPETDLQLLNVTSEYFSATTKENKMVPLKGDIYETAKTDATLECGIPNYNPPARWDDIKGSLTHLGNVDGGYGDLSNCRMIQKDGMPFLLVDASGQFMSANGDVLTYEGQLWFSMTDPSLSTSKFTITGGTGRWEHAKGYFVALFQPIDDYNIIFSVDGYVTPPGKNK